MYWPNMKPVALPVPEIIAIGVLGDGGGVANPNLGDEEAVEGPGWYKNRLSALYISTTMKTTKLTHKIPTKQCN